MRYALSSCLFGVPGKEKMIASNPCVTRYDIPAEYYQLVAN